MPTREEFARYILAFTLAGFISGIAAAILFLAKAYDNEQVIYFALGLYVIALVEQFVLFYFAEQISEELKNGIDSFADIILVGAPGVLLSLVPVIVLRELHGINIYQALAIITIITNVAMYIKYTEDRKPKE